MTGRYDRQGFLGARAHDLISSARIGVVGLNGGGSHIVQQAGHLGFRRFVVYDPDRVDREGTNLNRNVLATAADALAETPKVDLAARKLRDLSGSELELATYACRWQERPEPLRSCDIVFGCVDSFRERRDLEVCTRRFLIPLIDVGLDVNEVEPEPPRMAGQVILSMPGAPCMRCLGFLTEARLAKEAAAYGQAGPRPQVVWANGVLASLAVGVAVDLLTDWARSPQAPVYLSYDANAMTVSKHPRLAFLRSEVCGHFPLDAVGEPRFTTL